MGKQPKKRRAVMVIVCSPCLISKMEQPRHTSGNLSALGTCSGIHYNARKNYARISRRVMKKISLGFLL
jgi:hypothetical protein